MNASENITKAKPWRDKPFCMPSTKSFGAKKNEAVRSYIRKLINTKFGGVQSDCAEAMGVQQGYLSEFMSGKRGAGMKLVMGAAAAAETSVAEVMGDSAVVSVERFQVDDDPYPTRAAAIAAWKTASEKAVTAILKHEYDGADVFSERDWLEQLETTFQSFRRGHKNDPRKRRGARIATKDDD